jgi:UDP-N-acetylmuramyl pentapeptide phosphotransferase/UDP-N-acetylglucosamine-1-phosphate transferase
MACLSALLGDSFLLISELAMIGALVGFLVWNYPGGKIFLGDGGAYLLGFWLGEMSVLLVVRHPEISPWFPMLVLVYPIFETLYSMYRRKIVGGLPPGQPDSMHLHQMIYRRFAPAEGSDPNLVAPFVWLMTLLCHTSDISLARHSVAHGDMSDFFPAYVALYRHMSFWNDRK